MSGGHTPGPWKVDRDGDLPWMVLADFDDLPWGMVAEVPVFTGCEDEAGANARLLAAAPELLAALEAVEAMINKRPIVVGATTKEGRDAARAVFDQARAAINKATKEGEEA